MPLDCSIFGSLAPGFKSTWILIRLILIIFFFNDTATTEIYTLSLHDALPICEYHASKPQIPAHPACSESSPRPDRKSTRLNSSHDQISYAVFCLKKKVDYNFLIIQSIHRLIKNCPRILTCVI